MMWRRIAVKTIGEFLSKRRELGATVGSILLVLLFTLGTGGVWLSVRNAQLLLQITSLLGIMAVGQTLLIISGEFDLSVGSVFGLCGVTFVTLVSKAGFGVVPAFIISMLIALFAGWLNGLIALKARIPSLIATLGGLFIYRGLVYYVTGGFQRSFPREVRGHFLIKMLGGSFIYGYNNSIIWFLLITVIISIVLAYTVYGNRAVSVGGDPTSALSRGVNVIKTKWIAFITTSTLAGFAGLCSVSKLYIGATTLGEQMELESIASSVIGGCALTGGVGSIWGTAIGAFLLSTIRSGLIMMGAPPYWFVTFVGIILIIAVIFNASLSAWMKRRYYL
jgi:simple sugar transport system permease protein/ribose transport system permease protein